MPEPVVPQAFDLPAEEAAAQPLSQDVVEALAQAADTVSLAMGHAVAPLVAKVEAARSTGAALEQENARLVQTLRDVLALPSLERTTWAKDQAVIDNARVILQEITDPAD